MVLWSGESGVGIMTNFFINLCLGMAIMILSLCFIIFTKIIIVTIIFLTGSYVIGWAIQQMVICWREGRKEGKKGDE